ncbi:Signal transduction histidine kinase [Plantibacter flavus]|uniref:histidine kinase n=1 Tax=Plantibacter flavus TaxID=150123 RepID=A0A3N2C713_9MICO|nr:signal transduction histidine kinase [Plantibacter flavus]SMG22393.1 Signal transduction histidine kinase [Plantibacter flavus]
MRDPHPRPPVWVGDVVAAVLIIASAFIPFPNAEFRPGSPLVVALVVAPALLLPLRRRWPIAVLAAVIACYGAAAITGTLAPGVVIAAAIAMFGVAVRSARKTTLITAVATMVAVALLSLLASIGSFDPRTVQFAVMIAFAAAAGDGTRSRRAYILAITERAERAEQTREAEARRRVTEERLRIARDLHDTVAHQISVISLNAGVASSSLESRPEKAKEALVSIRRASRTVLGEIGDLLEVLRSDGAGAGSRGTLPQPGLDRLDALIAEFTAAGLDITTRIDPDAPKLSTATDVVAYRVVQEGLTNALKHGPERRAHVLVEGGDGRIVVSVSNPTAPGVLREQADAPPTTGHGLLGIRERVAAVRGTVDVGATPGGWRLSAGLPTGEPTHPGPTHPEESPA